MAIEKCRNFKREFFPQTRGGTIEKDLCIPKGKDMKCAGFSCHCPVKELFSPRRNVARETITFPK